MAQILNNADTIRQQAQLFDELRPDDGARLFLLKHTPDKSKFVRIIEVTAGWFAGFDKYREKMGFSAATLDEDFPDKFAQTTHFAYGIADADNEFDVFEIDERDKLKPSSAQPSWKCFGERMPEERYGLPVAIDP